MLGLKTRRLALGCDGVAMKTPYDLRTVAEVYRAGNIRSAYADAHLNLVASNLSSQLQRGGAVKALDVGCGAGGAYKLLNDKLIKSAGTLHYIGIDESERQIELAVKDCKTSDNVHFILGQAEMLPFLDNQFDMVFECRLFQFLSHPLEVLKEMVRISRDLVIANVFTYETNLGCFHPFYSYFEMDEHRNVISGGSQLHELNIQKFVSALFARYAQSNNYYYAFAKQKRTILAHAELNDYLAHFPGRVVSRDVVAKPLDTIFAADGDTTGLTKKGDRLEWPIVSWQTLVLAKQC